MRPTSFLRARTGAALAAAAVALAGASAVAHSATRADTAPSAGVAAGSVKGEASPDTEPPGLAVGPDATGPAAFGLCKAWSNHHKHDDGTTRAEGSVAMRNLIDAAGGEARVETYCASVPHPSERDKAGADASGKSGSGDKPGKGAKGPKEKVQKEEGKAGRSGKDKPEPSASQSPAASPTSS